MLLSPQELPFTSLSQFLRVSTDGIFPTARTQDLDVQAPVGVLFAGEPGKFFVFPEKCPGIGIPGRKDDVVSSEKFFKQNLT